MRPRSSPELEGRGRGTASSGLARQPPAPGGLGCPIGVPGLSDGVDCVVKSGAPSYEGVFEVEDLLVIECPCIEGTHEEAEHQEFFHVVLILPNGLCDGRGGFSVRPRVS